MHLHKQAYEFTPYDVTKAVAIGGGLGVSARLLRHILDSYHDRADSSSKPPSAQVQPVAHIPVNVSAEEAAQLEAGGVPVRKKEAAEAGSSFMSGVGLGAAGTAAAGLGWYGMDKLMDHLRRGSVQERLERQRQRVQALLEDKPEPEDLQTHAVIKQAFDMMTIPGWMADHLPAPVAPLMGGALVLGGLHAYNQARRDNRYEDKLKAIRKSTEEGREQPPIAVLDPVLEENPALPEKDAGSPSDQAEEAAHLPKLAAFFKLGEQLSTDVMSTTPKLPEAPAAAVNAASAYGNPTKPNPYSAPVGGQAQPMQANPRATSSRPTDLVQPTAA